MPDNQRNTSQYLLEGHYGPTIVTSSKGLAVARFILSIVSNFQTFPESPVNSRQVGQVTGRRASQEGELPGKTEPPTPLSGASCHHGSSGMGLDAPPKPGVAPDAYLSPQTLGTFLAFPILFPVLLSHVFIKWTTPAPASH